MQRVKEINQSIWQWLNRATPEALYDRQLVWIALGLMLTGLVMVTSASFPISARLTDQPFHFMFRHAIFLVLALIVSSVILQIPMKRWFQYSMYLLGLSFFLLVVVLAVGKSVNGASRWIPLGLFNLQPAEVAKLSLFIFMAGYLVRKQDEVRKTFFGGFGKPDHGIRCFCCVTTWPARFRYSSCNAGDLVRNVIYRRSQAFTVLLP